MLDKIPCGFSSMNWNLKTEQNFFENFVSASIFPTINMSRDFFEITLKNPFV